MLHAELRSWSVVITREKHRLQTSNCGLQQTALMCLGCPDARVIEFVLAMKNDIMYIMYHIICWILLIHWYWLILIHHASKFCASSPSMIFFRVGLQHAPTMRAQRGNAWRYFESQNPVICRTTYFSDVPEARGLGVGTHKWLATFHHRDLRLPKFHKCHGRCKRMLLRQHHSKRWVWATTLQTDDLL